MRPRNDDLLRLAVIQRRAQVYLSTGTKRGNHTRIRRAMRLLTLANARVAALARNGRV
jgi:hypothetical protein